MSQSLPHIGVIIPEFPAQTHAFFWREIGAMEEAGASVTILSTRKPPAAACPHPFRDEAVVRTTYLFPPVGGWIGALLKRPSKLLSMLSYVAGLSETPVMQRLRLLALIPSAAGLAALAKEKGLTHVHIHSCANAAHLGALAHRLTGVSYSLTLHGDLPVYGTDHAKKFAHAAFISAVTAPLAKAVNEVRADVAAPVIMMGVDTDQFQPVPKARGEQFTLVSVARLNMMKGHRFILRAMASLRDQGDMRLRYRVAGDGPAEAEILAEIAALKLEDQVEMLGSIGEDEVLSLLTKADALSLTSTGRGEAAPVAVMEAMSCGLPVVASIIGGVPDMIEDGVDGFLVPQEDVPAIEAALKRLMDSPETAEAIGKAARATALRKFGYRANAGLLLDQIQAALR